MFNWWFQRRTLDQLFNELKQIAAEDRDYHSRIALTERDHHNYVTRQTRRMDILNRIAEINARNRRHSGGHPSFFVG